MHGVDELGAIEALLKRGDLDVNASSWDHYQLQVPPVLFAARYTLDRTPIESAVLKLLLAHDNVEIDMRWFYVMVYAAYQKNLDQLGIFREVIRLAEQANERRKNRRKLRERTAVLRLSNTRFVVPSTTAKAHVEDSFIGHTLLEGGLQNVVGPSTQYFVKHHAITGFHIPSSYYLDQEKTLQKTLNPSEDEKLNAKVHNLRATINALDYLIKNLKPVD